MPLPHLDCSLLFTQVNKGIVFDQSVRRLSTPLSLQPFPYQNHKFTDAITINELLANYSSFGAAFRADTRDLLYDRADAWHTDALFLSPKRWFSDEAAGLGGKDVWTGSHLDFISGDLPTLRGFHNSALSLIFIPIPDSMEGGIVNTPADVYIIFATALAPGASSHQFDLKSGSILWLGGNNITSTPDEFNLQKTAFLESTRILAESQKWDLKVPGDWTIYTGPFVRSLRI